MSKDTVTVEMTAAEYKLYVAALAWLEATQLVFTEWDAAGEESNGQD